MHKCYKSRYIVDVVIDSKYIELTDSNRQTYYIDPADSDVVKQFQSWFNTIFSKGVNQHLTVFECTTVSNEEVSEYKILKFINT